MYISLKESCSKGFNKWPDAHQPEITKDVVADAGSELAVADPGLDDRPVMSPEQSRHAVR